MKYLVCPKCHSDDISEEGIENEITVESYVRCDRCNLSIVDFTEIDEVKDFIASDNKLSRMFDEVYKVRESYKKDKNGHGGKRFMIETIKATPFELYVHAAFSKADIYNKALMHDTIVSDYSIGYRSDLLSKGADRIVIEIELLIDIIIANGGMYSPFIVNWRSK